MTTCKSSQKKISTIDEYRTGVAILPWGINSGQASIKFRDVACDVQPPPLKNCKDLTMKLGVKYLFPVSSSDANFYSYQFPEGLGMRKILASGIRMQENLQTRGYIFWIFTGFHGVNWFQSQPAPLHGNFFNGFTNPEIVSY